MDRFPINEKKIAVCETPLGEYFIDMVHFVAVKLIPNTLIDLCSAYMKQQKYTLQRKVLDFFLHVRN